MILASGEQNKNGRELARKWAEADSRSIPALDFAQKVE